MLKSFFENEAHAFLLKLCVGLVCVSVIIFSLFQIGYAFQVWALKFEDSFAIVSGVFVSTLVLSLIVLAFTFRKKTVEPVVELPSQVDILNPLMNFSFQEKGLTFARGLLDGLMHGRQPRYDG